MNVPNHVAIILDCNGRWAKSKGMPRHYGQVKGCQNLEDMCEVIMDMGVKYLTVYAFSTENWRRSKEEVEGLLDIFRGYLKRCKKIAKKHNLQIRIIGDPTAFPEDLQNGITELEEYSSQFDGAQFLVALNYGGRDELTRAMKKMGAAIKAGELDPSQITETTVSDFLDTAGVPDPDLMIRTSGEQRLSNFLTWQLAYTEFYFTEVPWPDFDKEELVKAFEKYNKRDRRFGGVKEE